MKLLRVVIEEMAVALASNDSYERKIERVLSSADALNDTRLEIRSISKVILIHIAKIMIFKELTCSWEKEISDNMLNDIGDQKLKITNKYPTKTQIESWMFSAGNEVSDMIKYLKIAKREVKNMPRIAAKSFEVSPENLFHVWKSFVTEFSSKYCPNKDWTEHEVKEILTNSKAYET
jgi:hypothetical protein